MNLWTETDILYALFILKANHYIYEDFVKFGDVNDDYICSFVGMIYADLFEDRGIAEIEHERWIDKHLINNSVQLLECEPTFSAKQKIKFRFVEDV